MRKPCASIRSNLTFRTASTAADRDHTIRRVKGERMQFYRRNLEGLISVAHECMRLFGLNPRSTASRQ